VRERLSYGKNLKPSRFVPRATRVTIYIPIVICARELKRQGGFSECARASVYDGVMGQRVGGGGSLEPARCSGRMGKNFGIYHRAAPRTVSLFPRVCSRRRNGVICIFALSRVRDRKKHCITTILYKI